MTDWYNIYKRCTICPRNCGTDREKQLGACGADAQLKAARAALHFWEEPCISGKAGSGAVFFSGCGLRCVFCQNQPIAQGNAGKNISAGRLAEIFLELQEQGASNINLVTAGHFIPHVISAVESARRQGLRLPIVYNTSSYEKVDAIKRLEGIADIYLPDFKYWDSNLARRFSHAPDYPFVAKAAIAEMVRQQPKPSFYPEPTGKERMKVSDEEAVNEWRKRCSGTKTGDREGGKDVSMADDGWLMKKGVIVRQLLLPGHVSDAKQTLRYLHETYGNNIYISLMSQYTPVISSEEFPELGRRVTKREYGRLVDLALELGVEQAFIQEENAAKESFIPHFDGQGV